MPYVDFCDGGTVMSKVGMAPDLETSVLFGRSSSFSGYLQGICRCYLVNEELQLQFGASSAWLDSVPWRLVGELFNHAFSLMYFCILCYILKPILTSTAEGLAGDSVFHYLHSLSSVAGLWGSSWVLFFSEGSRTGRASRIPSWEILYLSLFPSSTGFPGGAVIKNLPTSAGDSDLISGSGRSSGLENGKPL